MHVVVVTRSTPDGNAKITVKPNGVVDWGEKLVINPWDEYTVTEAILTKENNPNVKVSVLALGGEEQNEALKQGLALGADEVYRVWDSALADYDSLQYSKAIAAAVKKLGDVDLVLFGKEFTDVYTDQHIYQVARLLGWNVVASMTKIANIDIDGKTVKVERQVEEGQQTLTTKLPAILGLFDDINEAKYPSFINIRKASKAQIPVWSLADLGLDAGTPKVKVAEYINLPARSGSVTIIDGDNPAEKAKKLVEKLMEAKVL